MIRFQSALVGAICMVAPFSWAEVPEAALQADVLVLGEVHDNPAHHALQLDYLEQVRPKAVVYEMLTPEEADDLQSVERTPDAMVAASQGFVWSNIADYAALFAQSEQILGAALPRDAVRAAFEDGAATQFGVDADTFGLSRALSPDEQTQREDLQFAAHCDAMPRTLMSGMVEAQRLRDAHFARVVLSALETYGAPVVLITGNGHARVDWGVPSYLARVRPELPVFALGQLEDGQVGGPFDATQDAPSPERADPCAAFQ